MTEIAFTPFPKIPRLFREVIVTEKIDGTNASITVAPAALESSVNCSTACVVHEGVSYDIFAASRTRFVWPGQDNHGFAAWVFEHADELVQLGPGTHFGEWWGKGIQRGYGLSEKRFSLFNVSKWAENRPACCHVVPVLKSGFPSLGFDGIVQDALIELRMAGSRAAPGFMNPEGVIAYHTAGNLMFKATLERDEEFKGKVP